MKILFHCCCAPCSIYGIKYFRSRNLKPHLFWYNPYIYPHSEFASRLDCLKEHADNEKLNLTVIDEYDYSTFNSIEKEERCVKCYSLRLEKTASTAAREGFTAFTTSLLISPYQDHEAILSICREAAARYSVEFFYKDFRPYFRESQSAARAGGMYMQKYCGCVYSRKERFSKL